MSDRKLKEYHLALEETIGFLLWDAHRAMTRQFGARIAVYGLSIGIFPFLRALWEEEGLTLRELADRVRMRGPTAVAAIRRLEESGFVRRQNDPRDRRKVKLWLTDKGRSLYGLAMPEVETVKRLMLADFSEREQETFKQMLRRVRRNIGNGIAHPAATPGAKRGVRLGARPKRRAVRPAGLH